MTVTLKPTFLLYLFFVCHSALAQSREKSPRLIIDQDKGWQFVKDSSGELDLSKQKIQGWQKIALPHTWNVNDVMDDIPGYYRGIGWYKKTIVIDKALQHKKLFLYFEGADQQTEIFVNGKKAGNHIGGYTAFCIPVTALINSNGSNEITIKVDNSFNENIPPLSADFTFYGGIYRSVSLIATDDIHFSMADHASKAVYISTPVVSEKNATIDIKGGFENNSGNKRKIQVISVINDRQNKKTTEIKSTIEVQAGEIKNFSQHIASFITPHLWSPEDPYLYSVTTKIVDAASGIVLDEVKNPLGFRWFSFDAGKGFFLNGKSYKLIGTSRHQDYKGMGNAVSKKIAREDIVLIKNTGSNFFRAAHYPQDPAVLQACDELGLLASVEIPIVNEITESETFYSNCMQMQVEMIRQNYNHPSVILWCYMNEVFLKPHFANDKERQKKYFSAITTLAQSLDSITRKEDPYRYTMIANHADFNRYNEYKLTTIAMVTGWNLYSGWYGGKQEDFPAFLDRHHETLPQQSFMITEYGADADNRIRSMEPLRFDKSVEYTTRFHQFYITEIMKRPFVAGAVVWNLADFNSETRTETMPHINNKGLLTWDRTPKDPYYLYQASFLTRPFIKISSAGWRIRGGVADSAHNNCVQPLQVASNLSTLQLSVNSNSIGTAATVNGLAEWNVPFTNGKNIIEVSGIKDGKKYSDTLSVHFELQPFLLNSSTSFKQLNILLGAKRYFIDDANQQVWLPDQSYRAGSWGAIGGKVFSIENNTRLPYGTDKSIRGTDNDPVYQTQQVGIKAYCFDVPAGNYELTLHFAELQGGVIKMPPYNLGDSARDEDNIKRVFDVVVNEQPFLQHFNMLKEYGSATAIIKKTTVTVGKNTGITITFKALEGEPVLNAIQLRKID
jgi:beta-galactosidase